MVSIEQEREAMFKKLQLLRSITNSHAHDKESVNFPTIRVEEQEDDFLIKVFTTRNCQGLLVFILEAFEELGLEVLQATISTSDSFILEAIATRENKEADDHIDDRVVKQVVLRGIQKWIEGSERE
ncbi:hypothetical protein OIU77_006685 [Salix suchowensis]|uniref:Plant bHLH transcription factor ACT-like domain-containing protein n=1 Tax=Salix suchowensis TaxID=1278906 RepID=A0ABQ9ALK2_9ROSI|nr:hypothetical protein OIU77_006685 [Salix suchowensis]